MNKRIFSVVATLFIFTTVAAAKGTTSVTYPGVGGDSLFDLSSPYGLTYASSVVGGGVFYSGPTSITVNPAITAHEQRVGLNAGYSALVTTGNPSSFGSAFQVGIMIPFKWAIFSGYVNGTFPNSIHFGIKNSMNVKAGLAKEITDNLSIGLGLNTGAEWGYVSDWSLSANLGFVYKVGNLGFMKDFRYGASILNLGKNYAYVKNAKFLEHYPCFGTVKVGAAGLLFANDIIKLGASLDLTTPCFTNLILDTGLQFIVKDMLTISVAEKINIAESIKGVKNFIPSVGIFFRFTFGVKNNDYLASHDWSESEMSVGAAYKNIYKNVQVISAGVDLLLGLKDETPPVIEILFDDDEE